VINEAKKTGAAVVLLPDNDDGGENALINLYKNLKQKKIDTSDIQIAKIPEHFSYDENEKIKDIDEWFFGRKTTEIKLYLSLLKIQTLKEYAANIELKEYFETLKNVDIYPTNIKEILIKQQKNRFSGSFVENIENVNESWDKYINRNSDIVNVGGVQLQEGAVNLIASDNGIGKTFITLQLCVNYILKKLKRVFFWAGEDDKATIIKRLNLIFSRMDSEEDIQIVKERLDIATYISEPFFKTDYGNVEETKEFKIFKQLLKDDQYGMIVLDPLSSFLMMIPEVDNTKVRWGMTKFNKIVSESDKILVFTHHINKDSIRGDGSLKELNKKLQNGEEMNPHEVIDIANGLKAAIRGGMAITDLPRLVYFVLATQPDKDGYAQRLLFRIKSNAGLTQEYIPIKLPFKSQIQQQQQETQKQAKTATKTDRTTLQENYLKN
jgi:archaellum biogenesis ATPase FlaH